MRDGRDWKSLKDFVYAKICDELYNYKRLYNQYIDNFEMVKNRFELHENYINFKAQRKLGEIKISIGYGG